MRFFLLTVLCLIGCSWASSAQTRIDPSFLPQRLYEPASAAAALQLSNGNRLVFGVQRAEHQDVPGIAAYLPNGQLDTQFQANLAAATWTEVRGAAEAPGGKIWVVAGSVAYGSTTYFQLVRLNADGTRDASFAPRTSGWGIIYNVAAQPDGKIVVGGQSLLRPGFTTTVSVMRLNADGTPDTAFNTRFAALNLSSYYAPDAVVLQPDGKLLCAFTSPLLNVFRLNLDGSQDSSFQLRFPSGGTPVPASNAYGASLALQPDGKVLLGANNGYSGGIFMGLAARIVRFGPTGIHDTSFAAPTNLYPQRSDYLVPTMQVRPDGRILVAVGSPGIYQYQLGASQQYVAQLLATGAFDPAWRVPARVNSTYGTPSDGVSSIQLLASGQVLTAGGLLNIEAATALPTGVHLLQATGAPAPFVAPLLQQPSSSAVTLQPGPGGKILVSGWFSEINGVASVGLARLNADGSTDAGFVARSPFATAAPSTSVTPFYTYPDGRVLVGGYFSFQANGQQHVNLVRLLANGRLDSTFVSAAYGPGSPYGSGMSPDNGYLRSAQVQPGGSIVVMGLPSNNASVPGQPFLARLTDTGQLDATFQPAVAAPTCLLVRPDGRVLVGAPSTTGQAATVTGLLADGGIDPAFTPASVTNGTAATSVNQLVQTPGGKILFLGNFTAVGTVATARIGQLTATGAPDPTFAVASTAFTPLYSGSSSVFGLAVQPNGRIVVGGFTRATGQTAIKTLLRLLPNGALDTGFAANLQPDFYVFTPVVQPDGAILVPGYYTTIGGQLHIGLARLLDANVLHVPSAQVQANTSAYPVPAHGQLTLRLDAAARPKAVFLLDALGRPVLRQAVLQPEMQLATDALTPGVYLLRVEYATGAVTRRVVLE
ncbi:T9SS type A sorting domain-containing protein [Hymenobacter monticola]|uniref:T9SS type A sorting domain-containing protein n=1 Tax=Hymenobacter monticola TaxID=1705399 RepID=A0ABY4B814_9BACT|nr:T9SS type A sorting domain-containing protein [Hymenobacter monticola]UOE35277.1 T9SS type A sorting domain-containing protein [Hymenobacter monticola]